jgi:hypothetical protein
MWKVNMTETANLAPTAFIGEIRIVAFDSNDPYYQNTLVANGWRECNGDDLSIANYTALHNVLHETWGTRNMNTSFKIPDFRGQFLRGWNHGSNNDPDANNRAVADPTNPQPGWAGNDGDKVASTQPDVLQNHAHDVQGCYVQTGQGWQGGYERSSALWTTGNATDNNNPSATRLIPSKGPNQNTSSETRPKNISVMYVIYTGTIPASKP